MNTFVISYQDVVDAIKTPNPNKAYGPDMSAPTYFASQLTLLHQFSIVFAQPTSRSHIFLLSGQLQMLPNIQKGRSKSGQ
jgi:hypothetical protein